MSDTVSSFQRSVKEARTFEEAARAALGVILERCEERLRASSFAGKGRILRGMVHIRPGGTYVRVFLLDVVERPAASYAPSASAFRWAREHARPIAIDVQLGVVEGHEAGSFRVLEEVSASAFDTQESRATLLERRATHLLVLPLRAAGGEVAGMITVEADCRAATGAPFLWGEVLPYADEVAAGAAAWLFDLPSGPCAPPKDPYLPVTGATMQSLVDMLRVFAQLDETLLLSGPTGAGKSRLARFCHASSHRSQEAFETLDLMTVPEDLQMAELFGWRKGAFTGAVRDNMGCLGRAEGGSLFIDEIDKLSLKAQAGLLRVLEERTYRPLGEASGERAANVRFIVGTNANLSALVRSGLFREDLFFRIHVLPVRVPPLAERRDEIVAWAQHMLERRHGERGRGEPATLSVEAQQLLKDQPWPGNLRQLDNILRRAYALFLVEAGGTPGPVVLDAQNIQRALSYEVTGEQPRSLLDLMSAAAAEFVAEAERRPRGSPLDADLALSLVGFVYGTAVKKLGSVDEAFRLLGKESLVHHRNHSKTLRRELARVAELCASLGSAPSPFAGLLEEEKK